jgi:hypothetical protein
VNLNPEQFGTNEHQFNGSDEFKSGKSTFTMERSFNSIKARTSRGKLAGVMAFSVSKEPEQSTIGDIKVNSPYRRKGIGAAMLDYARQTGNPDLHHSHTLTTDGTKFAAATPRTWQPKLPLNEVEYLGKMEPNGGENGPSPWSSYVNFSHVNTLNRKRDDTKYEMRRRELESQAKEPNYEQGQMF